MGNLTLEDVNNMYLDVLKEIGNIGAGNATTAIANMLGMKIDMNVPNVKLMEVSKLGTAVGAEDETIVGIFLEVMNDIEGSMMFLVDIPSARYLVNKLMMEDVPADKPFDEGTIRIKRNRKHHCRFLFVSSFFYDKSCDFSVCSIYCGGYGSFYLKCAGY